MKRSKRRWAECQLLYGGTRQTDLFIRPNDHKQWHWKAEEWHTMDTEAKAYQADLIYADCQADLHVVPKIKLCCVFDT